jgi:hypothetical protein
MTQESKSKDESLTGFKDPDWKRKARTWAILSPGITLLLNALGAGLTFFYFGFLEPGLESHVGYDESVEKTVYFLLRATIICTATTLLATRHNDGLRSPVLAPVGVSQL